MIEYELKMSCEEPVLIFKIKGKVVFMVFNNNGSLTVNNPMLLKEHKYKLIGLEKEIIKKYKEQEEYIKEFIRRIEKY